MSSYKSEFGVFGLGVMGSSDNAYLELSLNLSDETGINVFEAIKNKNIALMCQ